MCLFQAHCSKRLAVKQLAVVDGSGGNATKLLGNSRSAYCWLSGTQFRQYYNALLEPQHVSVVCDSAALFQISRKTSIVRFYISESSTKLDGDACHSLETAGSCLEAYLPLRRNGISEYG